MPVKLEILCAELLSNFSGGGAFDHLFGPGREEFEKKISKNSNALGVAREVGNAFSRDVIKFLNPKLKSH